MAYSLLGQVNAFRTTTTSSVSTSVTYSGGERVVIASIWNENGAGNTVNISDGTNTYSQLASYATTASGPNGPQYLVLTECKSATAGTYTVTATVNVLTNLQGISIYRYSGLSNSAAAIVATASEQSSPGTGSNAVASGSITPSAAPAMVFGYTNNLTDTLAPTAGTGFTSRGDPSNWTPGQCGGVQIEDRRVTTIAPVTATFTAQSPGTETFATLGIVIPEAGSATSQAMSAAVIGSSLATRF